MSSDKLFAKFEQTIIITLFIIFVTTLISQNDTIVNQFTDYFFEPNTQTISVECMQRRPRARNHQGTDSMGVSRGGAMNVNNNNRMRGSVIHATGPLQGGTASASYQMYQQAVNAATPTKSQLEQISNLPGGGDGYINTPEAPGIVPPSGKDTIYNFAAVNYGNRRAELISPCAQNAPSFVATSLLPKSQISGLPSWQTSDTKALMNQDFLSPVQQIGTDTVMSSLRNSSYDLRDVIPNPVDVVAPWNQSTIAPELMRRPISTYVPENGIYGNPLISKPPLGLMGH